MNLTFRFVPASDESVDSQYDLLDEGCVTNIYIQDCRGYGGGYVVSECGNEGTEDSYWTRDIGHTNSRAKAFRIADAHYTKQQNGG
jgi:hypothetical protein